MNGPHAPGVEAASWAVTAHLATRLDDRFRLIEGHPAGGQVDLLWFVNADASQFPYDDVKLAVHGTGDIRVSRANGTEVLNIGGVGVWQSLAAGGTSQVVWDSGRSRALYERFS